MRLPARLDVLRLRNFRNLFLGEAVSTLGDGLFPVALTFGVLDLHHSGTEVGVVLAAFSLPMVLFTLVGGVWSDRLRREWVMIASDLIRFVTMAVIAALAAQRPRSGLVPRPAGLRLWLRRRLLLPAYGALIQQLVPPERLQEANALRGMADGFGWFVGPAISGILVARDGRRRDPGPRRRHLPRQRRLPAHAARARAAAHQSAAKLPRRAARRLARGALADLAVGDDVARHARPVRDHRAAAGARPAGAHRAAPEPGALGPHGGALQSRHAGRRPDRAVLPAAATDGDRGPVRHDGLRAPDRLGAQARARAAARRLVCARRRHRRALRASGTPLCSSASPASRWPV